MSDREAWTTWAAKNKNPRVPLRNKYGAHRVELDGIWFDSQREAARYRELCLMEQASLITELQVHPAFPLMVPDLTQLEAPQVFYTIGVYHADFRYLNLRTGELVVEDVKSPPTKTPAYRRTKKHVEAQYQITIVEVE
jgi:hypothetical protein